MNNRDRENLEFLLTADKETLREWYNTVSEDDINYATDLLTQYGNELKVRKSLAPIDNVVDVSYANSLLNKYRLKP